MLSVELNDLIKQIISTKAESQTIEVKAAHGGTPKRLYDTLSSFSNPSSVVISGSSGSSSSEDIPSVLKKSSVVLNSVGLPGTSSFPHGSISPRSVSIPTV